MTTSATTLRDTIANLSVLPDDATLFVERIDGVFRPESRAAAVLLSDEDFERPLSEVAASRAPGAITSSSPSPSSNCSTPGAVPPKTSRCSMPSWRA
jgi:hypothetical protein